MNSSRKILLVEDNPGEVELAKRALVREQLPHQLMIAQDGQEALDFLLAEGQYAGRDPDDMPALVLLDLNLPVMPGLEVLRRIRTLDRLKRLIVVVLSSSNEKRDLSTSFELGANSYIRKPVDFEKFCSTLKQLCTYWFTINEIPPAK